MCLSYKVHAPMRTFTGITGTLVDYRMQGLYFTISICNAGLSNTCNCTHACYHQLVCYAIVIPVTGLLQAVYYL